MKILHTIDKFFPEYTGTSVRAYNILSRINSEVTLITQNRTLKGDIIRKEEEKFNNINVKRVPINNSNPKGLSKVIPFRYYYHLSNDNKKKKIIKEKILNEKFDILHAHDLTFYGLAALESAKITKKPFVLEMHIAKLPGIKWNLYEKILLKKTNFFEFCNKIIVLTDNFKKKIIEDYDLNHRLIEVVPNGVDTDHFKRKGNISHTMNLKSRLKLNNKVVMYSGYMDDVNGINDILEIAPSILNEFNDITFLFLGHGPESNKIISLAKKYDEIKFIPMVNYQYMPYYYSLADVFILPRPSTVSTETIIPLKLLEAMSMGCNVLGSNVGGLSEVIKDGKNGYLFEKENIEDLKYKLYTLLSNDNKKTQENARKTIINDYNWQNSALKLQNLYNEIID